MKSKVLVGILIFLFSSTVLIGQSFWFGPYGGLSVGTQQGQRTGGGPLLAGNFGFFLETLDEDKTFGSLYASLGLHQRGASSRSFFTNGTNIQIPSIRYVYSNISLQLGAKKFINDRFYYNVGIRGEYNAFTNLLQLAEQYNSAFFPLQEFVRPFVGGISGGAGYQFEIGDLYGVSASFSIHPDFFNQYISPEITGVLNPFTNQPVTISAQEIRNTTMELTFAFRFLRKVEYID